MTHFFVSLFFKKKGTLANFVHLPLVLILEEKQKANAESQIKNKTEQKTRPKKAVGLRNMKRTNNCF